MTEQYTLTCEKCGQPYISSDGFPRLQRCPSCSKGQLNLETLREEFNTELNNFGRKRKSLLDAEDETILVSTLLSIKPLDKVFKLLDQTRDKCSKCDGTGEVNGDGTSPCGYCQGTGFDPEWHIERLVVEDKDQTLPYTLTVGNSIPFISFEELKKASWVKVIKEAK